jgi:hypothetical protein
LEAGASWDAALLEDAGLVAGLPESQAVSEIPIHARTAVGGDEKRRKLERRNMWVWISSTRKLRQERLRGLVL